MPRSILGWRPKGDEGGHWRQVVSIRYAPKYSPLYVVQTETKAAKFELWADNAPMPPWEWSREILRNSFEA